jgi:hypothetical protein
VLLWRQFNGDARHCVRGAPVIRIYGGMGRLFAQHFAVDAPMRKPGNE